MLNVFGGFKDIFASKLIDKCTVVRKLNEIEAASPDKYQSEVEKLVTESGKDWRHFATIIHPDHNSNCKNEATNAMTFFNSMKKPGLKSKGSTDIDWSSFYGHSDRIAKIPYPDSAQSNSNEEIKKFACEVFPGFCEKMKDNIQKAKTQLHYVLDTCEGDLSDPSVIMQCPEDSQEAISDIFHKEIEHPIRDQQLDYTLKVAFDSISLDRLYTWLGSPSRDEIRTQAIERVNAAANSGLKTIMIEEAAQGLDCDRYNVRCSF